MNSEEEPRFRQTEIGLIPKDWQVVNTVGLLSSERGALKIGPFGSQLKKEFLAAEGFKLYGQENIFENDFLLGDRYVTKERFELLRSCELRPGDLIISMMGTIGFVTIVPEGIQRGIMDSHLLRLRINHTKYNARFLLYAFRSKLVQNQIDSLSVGTIMAGLSSRIIRMLAFPIPPLSEQQSIAKTLSDLDSKIELNQRMNKTLEAVGQAIFRRWFVDFEFPNQEGRPYKSSAGDFQASSLGAIPNEWTTATIADMARITLGGTPKRAESRYWGGKILWATAGNVAASSNLYIFDTDEKITEEGVRNSNVKVLPAETIIVTARGTVGEMRLLGVPSSVNQTCYALSPRDETSPYFMYYLLKTSLNQMKSLSYGTVFETITMRTFDEFTVVRPKLAVVKTFNRIVEPLFCRMKINTQENDALSKIRDSLLPRLMSGKIRVPISKENMEVS